MDFRDQIIPSNNRPDERKREEARIARANQLKPLAEPETPQVVQGDNTFSRVDVPNNESDQMSKTVREVLGPYYNLLGGSTNGYRVSSSFKEAQVTSSEKPKISEVDGGCDTVSSISGVSRVAAKQSALDTGQHQLSGHAHSNSSGHPHKPLYSSLGIVPGDSKRIGSSSFSSQKQSSSSLPSITPSKQSKAPVLSTPPGGSHPAASSLAVHSSSSPGAPVLSPYDIKDIPVPPKLKDGTKESNLRHRDKEHTPPPPSLTAKQALANVGKSPVKDASPNPVQSNHLSHLPSQSHSSSKAKPTPKHQQLSPSPGNEITTQQSSASKDHKVSVNHQPSPTPQQVSLSASSSTSASLNQKHSTSPSLPSAQGHASSPSAPTKVSSSPTPLLQSATPTKNSARLPNPNGVTTHSKMATLGLTSSSKPVNETANASTGSSVEKSRSLKLNMPTEGKTATTKSDLNDIFKEMTVQPPHTSIETPQKAGDKFPFPLPAIRERLQTLDIIKEKVPEDAKTLQVDDKLGDSKGCQPIVKDEAIIPFPIADIKEEDLSQKEDKAQTCSPPTSQTVKDEEKMNHPVREKAEEKLKQESSAASPLKRSPVDEKAGVSESVTANLPCYNARKPSVKSMGKTIPDENSILIRDLDLSEDSDAEPTSEDNTSASQSKKGKVIATPGAAPVKRARSPMSSSSSNISSDSSSESGGDDDDDDNEMDKNIKAKISSERRSSSSSSNSSSDSSSDSSSEENEDDENEDKDSGNEGEPAVVDRGEKTPSPPNRKGIMGPASVGTPSTVVQNNNDDSRIWQLNHFIQPSKKSSTSPANASPSKPVSPPTCHSAPPSVQHKEDTGGKSPDQPRQRSLKEIGPCNSMPFDITAHHRLSDDDSDDHQADREDNEDEDEFRRKHGGKNDLKPAVRKTLVSSSGLKEPKQLREDSGRKPGLKDSKTDIVDRKKSDNVLVKDSKMLNSVTNNKDKKVSLSVSADKLPSSNTKKRRSKTGSSSDDEIDVVGFTPDKKTRQLASSPDKTVSQSKQDVTKQLNGVLSMSSDEDSKSTMSRGKNAPSHLIKNHRRKEMSGDHNPSTTITTHHNAHEPSSSRATTSPVGKASKKLPAESEVALDHLESISRPPNLLSPIHPVCSPPPYPSTKPLPSFQTSFSPAPVPVTSVPPIVTLSHGTAHPKIMIHISRKLLSEKSLSRLKEKKEKRRRGGKTSSDTKSLVPTSKCDIISESVKESRVPPITDVKSSPHVNSSIRENDAPSLQTSSGTKRKAPVPNDAGDGGASNHIYKIPKSQKTSSELTSSTSAVSQDTDSSAAVPKSNKFTRLEPNSVSAHKSSSSSAVKNIDFSLSSSDSSRGDNGKPHKRKPDPDEEPTSKKAKGDLTIPDRSSTPTVSAPAPIRKRRDSANSTSSKSSRQSTSSKKSRRSSNASNVSNSNNNINNNNNNNIDKPSPPVTNGPTLPFNSYGTNGTSSTRVTPSSRQASLPSPLPVETQLLGHEHYLSRAKEHKHHADSQKDKMARFEPYLRSGLSFFLAGFSMEQCKKDLNASYSLYNDTSNLLQYAIRLRVNSSTNSESSDRERKLIVLIIRLRAYLNHRLYRLRKSEVSKLKKVIESEQSKLHTSSTATASSSASANSNSKPHAPSPHQNNWNKNSTGTPSPMSPTPSPATSVSSQGSCELVTGKITNGTSLTSPSPGMVSVHQRVHTVTQKYFALTSHLVKAMELWDQADAETKGLEDFFNILDTSCGVLTFHSEPPNIVRYMKHALRLLNL
ncbi:unnamed protein product [Lymnaea stagnalis]|uniref:AF4/FMR2 family member lilli n=1 Tax=Lymnaea stagnalis TaxID=6523 RepID=A0AAV2I896_LYMST